MGELVSFVCVRADHHWATGEAGAVHRHGAGLAYCPDASLGASDHHEWWACEAVPAAAAPALAAREGARALAIAV
jgi:hypothetical protein